MTTTREKPWMCTTCGYVMDAATGVERNIRCRRDGDVTLCLKCAAVYERRAGAWAPATAAEVEAWPAGVRRQIALLTAHIMSLRRQGRGAGASYPGAAGRG